ncbi:S9 family peptidase [Streptomyces catenulae]|uniref:Prolyl oligopeptidase family serine peptidase n=1 Tax=Streptomyces catenulae TaxID=66875 RepID=A0ABV2Z726_9ACTN|nr:prolyl oligopeptidase family serine peptidase [Streptomyces catenulae]
MPPSESLPHQFLRTRRFALGAPDRFTVSPDGATVLFLRSASGDAPVHRLWALDTASGRERLLLDPADPASGADPGGDGVTGYATDAAGTLAACLCGGALWAVEVATGRVRALPVTGRPADPRPDPTGRRVAYRTDGALRAIGADGTGDREIAAPDGPDVRFGAAEYAATASMGRARGYWWAPDGSRLLVARVDESAVARWYLADPAHPATPPRTVRYPAAGTANAGVTLWLVPADGGARTEVAWDRARFPYLTAAGWDAHGPFAAVQSRDQRRVRTYAVDPADGRPTLLAERRDRCWVTLVPGTPARTASGAWVAHRDTGGADGTRRLTVGGTPVTPEGLQLREVLGVDGEEVLFTASADVVGQALWSWRPESGARPLTTGPGVHTGVRGGPTLVRFGRAPDRPGATAVVTRPGRPDLTVASYAERPVLALCERRLTVTERALHSRLLLPSWHRPGGGRLPVLVDPYAGPALQRVTDAQPPMMFVSQWFAEQGFAVLVTDGRGTPGRSPQWERTVHGDVVSAALEDQAAAVTEVLGRFPELDPGRVAVRGWSFSGMLAVAAVVRRPDLFHAAVAGAGPYDPRLYDTHWRERFLGRPDTHPERYDACSLTREASGLTRPLLLMHGLADGNVHAAHTLRLSAALLAAGRPHEVLPLPGTGHTPTDPALFTNLLRHQVEFLWRHLGREDSGV